MMIKVEGLIKNYGLNPVLRGVHLQVMAGECVALVGANGAGKTTLLRILATLLKPDGGVVEVGGWQLPQNAGKVRSHIGWLSHHSLLYHDLTAAENLRFYAQLYRLSQPEKRIETALRTVGLFARQNDPVRTFSRGMLQRLTLARATLHEPDLLLLDEPYTGLDQDAGTILDQLIQAEKEKGRTIFMITHDFARGIHLCHRVLLLNRGKIVSEIAPQTIGLGDFLEWYSTHTNNKRKEG